MLMPRIPAIRPSSRMGNHVVGKPLFAIDGEIHFAFDLFTGKSALIILPPYRQLSAPGRIFGTLSDGVSPVHLAGGVLHCVAAIGTNGEEIQRQALDRRFEDGLAPGQFGCGSPGFDLRRFRGGHSSPHFHQFINQLRFALVLVFDVGHRRASRGSSSAILSFFMPLENPTTGCPAGPSNGRPRGVRESRPENLPLPSAVSSASFDRLLRPALLVCVLPVQLH